MTYYVHPIWFYLAKITDNISMLSTIMAVVVGIITIVGFVFYLLWKTTEFSEDYESDVANNKSCKKLLIAGLIVTLISSFIAIVTPTSDTIYKMMISSVVTYENVDKVKDDTKEIVDYIIEKSTEVQSNKKDE